MEGYETLHRGAKTAVVRSDDAQSIADALFDGTGCSGTSHQGRGLLQKFTLNGQSGLIRKCLRGGLIRHILGDAYLFKNRPLLELEIHDRLYAAGLPVCRPLGVCWEKRGIVYRGKYASQEISGVNLLEHLVQSPDGAKDVLERVGEVIHEMHELGVYHADLQIRNILVSEEGVYLLDFDNASMNERLSETQRARNLFRLRRSLQKNGVPNGCYSSICNGYGNCPSPGWLDFAYQVKGKFSDTFSLRGEWKVREQSEEHLSELALTQSVANMSKVLKRSSKSLTTRVGSWVVKQTPPASLGERLKQAFRLGKGKKGYEAAKHLAEHGVLVPKPIAHLELRTLGVRNSSAVIYEYLEDHVNVEVFARGLDQHKATAPECSSFLSALAQSVLKLDEARAYHADLSGKNILTKDGKSFCFIDLDSVYHKGSANLAEKSKNHVQLYDSFCDIWDDTLLGPFIDGMRPEAQDPQSWFASVKAGQSVRRSRHTHKQV